MNRWMGERWMNKWMHERWLDVLPLRHLPYPIRQQEAAELGRNQYLCWCGTIEPDSQMKTEEAESCSSDGRIIKRSECPGRAWRTCRDQATLTVRLSRSSRDDFTLSCDLI